MESAVANVLDVKKTWIEAALEDSMEIHELDSLEDYSGQFKQRIPRSLHRSLAKHSQREGISIVYTFFSKMTQCFLNKHGKIQKKFNKRT